MYEEHVPDVDTGLFTRQKHKLANAAKPTLKNIVTVPVTVSDAE